MTTDVRFATDPAFTVLNAARTPERNRWLDLWSRWPEREPAAHPDYLRAIAAPDESPVCATLDFGEGGVLYPFLLRPIVASDEELWDITGPMIGYTGAFQWNVPLNVVGRFWSQLSAWARAHHVVSSFARLSLFSEDLLPFDGAVRVIQPNVVRDLQMSDDLLWLDFEHKVRKNVKRARGLGVKFIADPGCERLDAFRRIYAQTMLRRGASPRHQFDLAFFETLVRELHGSVQLFFAVEGAREVAAELVLTSANHAYSFLGGTLAGAFDLRPNDLLKFEIICSLRDQGLTHFVLGGGPQPSDSIFRYKRSFAPAGIVDFKVGQRVHDHDAYDGLVHGRALAAAAAGQKWEPDPDFFPAYRAPNASPSDLVHEHLRPGSLG